MKYDAVILGGGPAAVSAALTLRARGKSAAILSGGIDDIPLFRAKKVTNYPGCPDISGRALLEAMERQALDAGAELLHGRATSVASLGGSFGIVYGPDFCEAETVILCTGVAAGKPFTGERDLLGRGVSYCVTCDGMLYRGKRVCVVGFTSDTGGSGSSSHHGLRYGSFYEPRGKVRRARRRARHGAFRERRGASVRGGIHPAPGRGAGYAALGTCHGRRACRRG